MANHLMKAVWCVGIILATSLAVSADSYTVTRTDTVSTKLTVTAHLSIKGTKLQMEESWPGDVPSVADKGWPALVHDLRVEDASGHALAFTSNGPGGWVLNAPYSGSLILTYTVDYAEAAAANWPAPREAAFADADHFSFAGKSLFITTPQSLAASVKFALPSGWLAVAPWLQLERNKFRPVATDDLLDNIIVLSRLAPDVLTAGGFHVSVTAMGKWNAVRPRIKTIVRGVIPVYLRMMGAERGAYSIVLLPISDTGGESYRNSFAFNVVNVPTEADSPIWGHTIAHEIFHYWNGWRLKGTDYSSSQWFQEGFTDYAADMAMAGSGSITERDFLDRIENNIARYGKLTTPLDAPGTRKGPPLYGGGALVALCWDIQIRNATGGTRTLADVLNVVWKRSDNGSRTYEWRDIKAALEHTARFDWEGFYQAHIHGRAQLPLPETLALAGLRISKSKDGTERVEIDATSTTKARSLRRSLTGRR